MSVNSEIHNYFRLKHREEKKWIAGGTIERYIYEVTGAKGSTVAKRLREMSGEGKTYNSAWHILDKREEGGFVWYKLKTEYL